jgi:RimJ/RimL family protein N-acetyltransferase
MINYGYGVMLDNLDLATYALYWRNDTRYNKFFRQTGLISDADHKKWIESLQGNNSIKMFSVIKGDGKFRTCIGVCGLTSIDYVHSKAEISCYTENWDCTTEDAAIKTIVDFGFKTLNLHRLWTETLKTHLCHLDSLRSLGFCEEGVLKDAYFKNGEYIDSVIHSLINYSHK